MVSSPLASAHAVRSAPRTPFALFATPFVVRVSLNRFVSYASALFRSARQNLTFRALCFHRLAHSFIFRIPPTTAPSIASALFAQNTRGTPPRVFLSSCVRLPQGRVVKSTRCAPDSSPDRSPILARLRAAAAQESHKPFAMSSSKVPMRNAAISPFLPPWAFRLHYLCCRSRGRRCRCLRSMVEWRKLTLFRCPHVPS